jgi:hypothetical protein
MKRKLLYLFVAVALVWLPIAAMADSITPSSVTASGPTGTSYTVNKTVTVNQSITTSLVDVFLLSDTTGSMGGTIAAVQASASAIVTAASGLGDVAFGVGEYKDKDTAGDPFNFIVNTAVTKTLANITAGIGAWSASGGGDTPEQALYALDQVAKNGAGDGATAVGWRAGSAKLVVWFGDAPSHDPSGTSSPGGGVTEAQTVADLVAAGVKVAGVNVSGVVGGGLDSAGQASAVTLGTGGILFTGIPSSDTIATIIGNLLTEILSTYKTVSLDTSEVPGEVGVSVTPDSYSGAFDRSIDRTFDFEVTFTDLEPGVHTFNIYALVDGARVATESDSITSTGGEIPEPATMILIGSGLLGIAGLRKRFKK